MQDIVTIFIS